jgi:hypothetical protein
MIAMVFAINFARAYHLSEANEDWIIGVLKFGQLEILSYLVVKNNPESVWRHSQSVATKICQIIIIRTILQN